MTDNNPIKPNDIVFLGDSLTEWFDLKRFFNRDDLRNRGMAGNMTDHVLYRLEEITLAKPKQVFLMIGINDLLQNVNPEQILKNQIQILEKIKTAKQDTGLTIQSLLPANEDRLLLDIKINNEIYKLNHLLDSYARKSNICYIDLHSEFLNTTGQLDNRYTFDGIHLNETGYKLWAQLIESFI